MDRLDKYDIGSVLEYYGVYVRSRAGYVKVKCPLHTDNDPSASVMDGRMHCFSCGFHGDAIDVVKAMDGVGYADAVSRCQEITGQGGDQIRAGDNEGSDLFGSSGNRPANRSGVATWGGLFT